MIMEAIHIRPARQQDIDSMILLLKYLFTIEEDFTFDPGRHASALQLLLANENALLLVAEVGGSVVGMCSGQIVISTAEGGLSLLVEDLAVVEQQQGKGIGRRLLQTLTEWAKSRRISRMQLLADRNNEPALKFYETRGWQSTQLICLRTYTGTSQQ